jgi:thiaminase
MALPIQNAAVYTAKVPSTKQEIKFRGFLVKEEKALLIAQQSEDPTVMMDTLKQIIKSCVKTELDVDALALFDIEYIFAQLRSKSVGELVDLMVACDVCPDEEMKARVKLSFDLSKLEVNFPADHNKKITLFDNVGVVMRYPSLNIIKDLENMDQADAESIFKIITKSIDFIYDGDELHYAKDQTEAELKEFLENLSQEQFKKIQQFFETMPKLSKEVQYDCPVCNHHHEKVIEGLSSFF